MPQTCVHSCSPRVKGDRSRVAAVAPVARGPESKALKTGHTQTACCSAGSVEYGLGAASTEMDAMVAEAIQADGTLKRAGEGAFTTARHLVVSLTSQDEGAVCLAAQGQAARSGIMLHTSRLALIT